MYLYEHQEQSSEFKCTHLGWEILFIVLPAFLVTVPAQMFFGMVNPTRTLYHNFFQKVISECGQTGE